MNNHFHLVIETAGGESFAICAATVHGLYGVLQPRTGLHLYTSTEPSGRTIVSVKREIGNRTGRCGRSVGTIFSRESLRSLRFPAAWEEVGHLVAFHGGQSLEAVGQLFLGIDAPTPATLDDRVDDGAAPTRT